MPEDKSLFHYGAMYHALLDPLIKPARQVIIDYLPAGSHVLDVGCGTGQLCFELARQKQCQVLGIDLSRRMLDFAQRHNPSESITFRHVDATHMEGIETNSFDYVVISHIIHELYREGQVKLVEEAWRVGHRVLLVDSNAPLPINPMGVGKRVVEFLFGFDHYAQFRAYLALGGIGGILEDVQLTTLVVDDRTFSANCLRLTVLAHSASQD